MIVLDVGNCRRSHLDTSAADVRIAASTSSAFVMSRHLESFVVNGSIERVQALCDAATNDLTRVEPWSAVGGVGLRTVMKQGWSLLTIKNPATLEITLLQSGSQVQVSLQASSLGFGPIQDGHVKAVAARVRTAVAGGAQPVVAAPPPTPAPTSSVVSPPVVTPSVVDPSPTSSVAHPSRPPVHRPQGIFVSYRREDSADVTGRLCDTLEREFGAENVFRDVDSIPLGVDFRDHLGAAVQRCRVLLAVIGKNWAGPLDDGSRRIDDPVDFVRVEIESAIARGVPVIPLLVGQAIMPKADMLPAALAPLAYRNGMSLRPDPDFRNDVARLCRDLHTHLTDAAASPRG